MKIHFRTALLFIKCCWGQKGISGSLRTKCSRVCAPLRSALKGCPLDILRRISLCIRKCICIRQRQQGKGDQKVCVLARTSHFWSLSLKVRAVPSLSV